MGGAWYPDRTAQTVVRVEYPGHRGHRATLNRRKTEEARKTVGKKHSVYDCGCGETLILASGAVRRVE
jgi:hypothetical protein